MKTQKFVTLICIIAVTLITANISAETVVRSFEVGAGGTLTIDAEIGSIEIRTTSTQTVDFRMKTTGTHAEKVTVDFELGGNDVLVTSDYTGSRSWGRKPKVRFLVTTPKNYNVELKTSGGSISIDDLDGRARAKTSGGQISFGQIEGEVLAKTSGGSITLDGCRAAADLDTSGGSISVGYVDGALKAETSGGSIHIGRVNGTVSAHTSGGGITLDDAKNTIDLRTSGGGIKASLSKQPDADCRLKTSGGSIRIELPADISVEVNASTSGGKVHSDFEVTGGHRTKKSLSGKINGGGPELFLRTSGGSVRIVRQ